MNELAVIEVEEETVEAAEPHLTLDQFKKCLPKRAKNLVNEKMVEKINDIIENTPLRESFRDNLLSFAGVLQEGKFKVDDYINAVRYVSHKLTGDSNIVAYTKVFPERYQRCVDNNWPAKDINSLVSAYNRNVMVNKILEQAMVPTWLLNQDLYQKALNASADLMMNAKSEKVRCDAAANLMTQLKMPEVAKVQIDMNVKEDDSISELKKSTLELVRQQRQMLEAGVMNAKQVAQQKIIEGVVIENGEEG